MLLVCKEIGAQMVQGYFVAYPTINTARIASKYSHIVELSEKDHRFKSHQNIILKRLEPLNPIVIGDSMESLLDLLKADDELFLVPVVDSSSFPKGIIQEHRLKSVIYSPYGRSLIQNRSSNLSVLDTYIEPIPVVDVSMPLETIIELFSLSPNAPGVLVIESSRYIGYLSAREMIEVVNERNLIRARDQNPLSRLPGNFMINEHIAHAFESASAHAFCYFDFDHFKPYNDHYGFRNGDRVILLFAELMHKVFNNDCFIGHIGGDDFFALASTENDEAFKTFCRRVEQLIEKFSSDVREFYNFEDRQRGVIVAEDREGKQREFNFLTVSAVIIYKSTSSTLQTPEQLQKIFAVEKKNAKKSPNHLQIIMD